KQGMEVVRHQRPDLVILDVMMSWVLDGVGMSNDLDRDPDLRRIPVIMVSSIASTEYAAEFPTDQPLHVDDFMSKPLKSAELVGKVKQILAGRVAT
ncbi:MAG: response regulator, partial [Chloroflexota bacterium]